MTLDGKPLRRWKEVFQAFYADAAVPASYSQVYGKVLTPNTNRDTTIDTVRIERFEQAKVFYAAQGPFDMTICYCSVYDDCWIAHQQDPEAQSVDRCDTTGTVQFEQQM